MGDNLVEKKIQDIAKLVGYVPQEHASTFPFLVKDIVLMGRSPHLKGVFGVSQQDKKIALEAMRVVGIEQFADKLYNQLSVGERQLVIIARALAQEAPMLFLDEPTSSLDFSNQIRVWRLLKSITSQGKTVMACTHDPNHVIWFCDHVIVLGKKGIVASGPPHDVISDRVLDQVYGGVCNVKTCNDVKMVLPRE
jgi:iron complex transport system ATP-binding protein